MNRDMEALVDRIILRSAELERAFLSRITSLEGRIEMLESAGTAHQELMRMQV